MSNWKTFSNNKPKSSGWYLTKSRVTSVPKVSMYIVNYETFNGSTDITLWCDIPK